MFKFLRKLNPIAAFNKMRNKPWLEVTHSGIDEHGLIKLELDWNAAFIRELLQNGFTGRTEEEMVRAYLNSITQKVEKDMGL